MRTQEFFDDYSNGTQLHTYVLLKFFLNTVYLHSLIIPHYVSVYM